MEQSLSESKNLNKINSINYMKLLFALLVISIHTKPFLDIDINLSNIICEIIAKLAVPFFFTTSGYFYFRTLEKDLLKKKKYLYRLIITYISWTVIYDFRQIFRTISADGNLISMLKGFIVEFFIYGSAFHMWYMVALIYTVIIVNIFMKYNKLKYLYILSIIFFIVGILLGPYYKYISNINIINDLYELSLYIEFRRLFTIAIPFFMLGYLANKLKHVQKNSLIFIIIFFILFILECNYIQNLESQKDMLTNIFMYPLIIFIFTYCLNHKLEKYNRYSMIANKLSSFVYFVHPIFISILKNILLGETLLFLVTSILSLGLGIVLIRINNRYINQFLF